MALKLNTADLPMGSQRVGSDTVSSGELQTLLGTEGVFEHRNWSAAGMIKPRLDARELICRLVRNESGSAKAIRLQVSYDTGASQWGREINALTGDVEAGAGIVDPFLVSTGIADNGIGWIVTRGPVDVQNTADAALVIGDRCVSAASGQLNKQTAAPASDTAVMQEVLSYVGRAEEAAAAVSGTVFRIDYRGEN